MRMVKPAFGKRLKAAGLAAINKVFAAKNDTQYDSEKALQRIARLQKYIESHYSETLTVAFACEFSQLDYNYFSRLFRKETGKTFIEYLNIIRINHAQQMLTLTDYPVSYIAQSVGIPNTTYFNRVFKTTSGMTPKQYRNKNMTVPTVSPKIQ